MAIIQTEYAYLLPVGFLTFSLLYWVFQKLSYFCLQWSRARFCGDKCHSEWCRKDGRWHGDPSRTPFECTDCIYHRWQLSLEISERCIGVINYSICSVLSYRIIVQTRHSVMNARSDLVIPFAQFSITYFIYDILAMYASYSTRLRVKDRSLRAKFLGFLRKRTALLLHHVLIVMIGYTVAVNYSWRNNFGDFFLGCLSIGDASSHFLSTAYILRLLNYEGTLLFSINGVLLLVSFMIFRIYMIFYMYAMYFAQETKPWLDSLYRMPIICHAGMLLVISFQTFWLLSILRGGYRFIRAYTRKPANSKDQ